MLIHRPILIEMKRYNGHQYFLCLTEIPLISWGSWVHFWWRLKEFSMTRPPACSDRHPSLVSMATRWFGLGATKASSIKQSKISGHWHIKFVDYRLFCVRRQCMPNFAISEFCWYWFGYKLRCFKALEVLVINLKVWLGIDCFTISFQSPDDRLIACCFGCIMDFYWIFGEKMVESLPVCKPTVHCRSPRIHCRWGFPKSIFRPANHKSSDTSQLEATSHSPLTILESSD